MAISARTSSKSMASLENDLRLLCLTNSRLHSNDLRLSSGKVGVFRCESCAKLPLAKVCSEHPWVQVSYGKALGVCGEAELIPVQIRCGCGELIAEVLEASRRKSCSIGRLRRMLFEHCLERLVMETSQEPEYVSAEMRKWFGHIQSLESVEDLIALVR